MNYSIIIPNLNGEKYLIDCLPSLLTSLKPISNDHQFEIILVDNNSSDDSISTAKKIFPQIKVILLNKNFGFAPAINQGIALSKYEWVVLLNNDLIISPDWFKIINHEIEKNNSKYTTYCGTVLTKDGSKYESSGLDFDYRGKCKNINNGQKYIPSKSHDLNPIPIWGSSAALVIYNKKILQKIGGFDNDFFAYEEDVDVALRLYLTHYKTLLVPNAISYHLGGGTSSRMNNFRQIMDAKNWFYIIIKDYPISEIKKNFLKIIIERLRNLSGLIKSTPIHKLPISLVKSYGEILIYLPKMLNKRKQFQKIL